MQFSKYTFNNSEQAYNFSDTESAEHDTTAQTLAHAEEMSAPPENEAEGSIVLVGNGGGIEVQITGIRAIAINGSIILDRLPPDND